MGVLALVTDPESGKGLVELGMIEDLQVRRRKVTVTVATSDPGGPSGAGISKRVTEALAGLDGVKDVTVNLVAGVAAREVTATSEPPGTSAPDAGAGRAAAPLGHEQGRANPFGPRSATRVLGISSGKGGVGKSTVTVNLAVALANAGHDVAVLDADVYGFSIPGMLGVSDEPSVSDLKMTPPVAHGVRCMSMGFFLADEQPVVWRGPMLHKALEQFLVDVDWGAPEFLLVDMPPGTGDVALSMAQYLPSSEIYVVTTPQPAARKVAQRSAYMAKKLKLPMRGVIENMSWLSLPGGERQYIFGQGGGTQLAEELDVPLLGQIPLDMALREGGDSGVPITVADPDSEAARSFADLASRVVARGRSRVFHPDLTVR
jgi:ATP-binding protein involved in chromosome partitioning